MTEITLYGKPNCVQCTAVKRNLDSRGVEYAYRNVEEDAIAYEHIKALGFQAVPVVFDGAGYFYGFDVDRLSVIH